MNSTISVAADTDKMPMHPRLLRTDPSLTRREAIAQMIRQECGARSWSCIQLAEVLNISVDRARHLYEGRRPIFLEELDTLCTAVNLTIFEFLQGADERRGQTFISEDTTVAELLQIAAEEGISPSKVLARQGWSRPLRRL